MKDRPVWQKVAIAALAIITIVWVSYNYHFKVKLKEAENLKSTLSATEKEIDVLSPKNNISKINSVATLEIEGAIKEISKKIPDEVNMPSLMERFIYDSSKDLDIDYRLVQPVTVISMS